VLEGIPSELARRATEAVGIPTIGIGAGPDCDGQVLVCYDFLGMYSDVRPKFVKRFAELGEAVIDATQRYVAEVRSAAFPSAEHAFGNSAPKPKPLPEETGSKAVADGEKPTYGPASDDPS
jgi:3-methyl-2-oxobutanoate hydroxymethyltransferase